MKIKYSIIAISLIGSIISCNNILERVDNIETGNMLQDGTLITSAKSAETALAGVYITWRSWNIGWFMDNLSTLNHTIKPTNIANINGFEYNDVLVDNESVANVYKDLYKVINMSNSFITILEKNPPKDLAKARMDEMIGEAKFQRGLAHFMLLRLFGEFYDLGSPYGIVLYDVPVRDNGGKARSTVQEVYDFILKDFEEAVQKTPEIPKGHYLAGKATALAFKSRLYLYMQDYAKASSTAQEALNKARATGYEMEGEYLDIYINKANSPEVLFSLYAQYPNQSSVIPISNTRTNKPFIDVADELVEGDKNLSTGEGMDPRYAKAFATQKVEEMGNTFSGNNKYKIPQFTAGENLSTPFYMRLAEVYLIKAEADARLGNYLAAKEALKVVTNRAGYSEDYVEGIDDQNLLVTIFKHKWMELAYENNEDWFDMVRYYKKGDMELAPKYIPTTKHLTMPIPQTALAGNKMLVQNPSYK